MGSQEGKPNPIIFTSGTFDFLHAGHIAYLHAAAHLEITGDRKKAPCSLVVGINSDESVSKYKKPNVVIRPFNKIEDRMKAVAALGCVDFVFPFDEVNNNTNIKELKPKYYAKGGDYTKEELSSTPLVESYGGEVVILPFEGGYSTTGMIERLVDEARILREGNEGKLTLPGVRRKLS